MYPLAVPQQSISNEYTLHAFAEKYQYFFV